MVDALHCAAEEERRREDAAHLFTLGRVLEKLDQLGALLRVDRLGRHPLSYSQLDQTAAACPRPLKANSLPKLDVPVLPSPGRVHRIRT